MPITPDRPDSDAGKDTYASSTAPTTNYGNAEILRLQHDPGAMPNPWFSTVMRFTIPSVITKHSKIQSALLKVYFSAVHGTTRPYQIARCKKLFDEPTCTFEVATAGIENWDSNSIRTSTNHDTTYAVTGDLPTSTGYFTFADIKDLAQDALDNHIRVLNIHIARSSNAAGIWTFSSSDHVTPEQRPLLSLQHSASGYLAASHFGQVHPTSGW